MLLIFYICENFVFFDSDEVFGFLFVMVFFYDLK